MSAVRLWAVPTSIAPISVGRLWRSVRGSAHLAVVPVTNLVAAVLLAAGLTMGAVSAPATPDVVAVPHRAAAAAALADLATAAWAGPSAVSRTAASSVLTATAADPRDAAAWWRGLDPSQRSAVLAGAPSIAGELDGLPFPVRDAANRAVLQRSIAAAKAASAAAGRGLGLLLTRRLAALDAVQRSLVATTGAARYLVDLDVEGDGVPRAAVAVGDPQTAASVDVLVPGMYFTVADQMVDWTTDAANIQAEQTALLARLGGAGTASVISWIGYRTPDILTVLGLGPAEEGAERLTNAVNGIAAARGGARPFVGLIAHSYGSTAAILALQAHSMRPDALALVGAPGSTASDAGALDVPAGSVFVGEAPLDGIATTGYFGSDPTQRSWGAVPLGTTGGVDPITGTRLTAAVGHNGYFAQGTESLRNLALIGIGRGGDVTDGTSAGSSELTLAR